MYHPKTLPNKEGFKFLALISDEVNGDYMEEREVKRRETGSSYVYYVDGFSQIKAWLPLSMKQPK